MVESIGHNCFAKAGVLSQLKFGSGDSLRRVVGQMSLDAALEHLGFSETTSLFRIEVTQGGEEFPGWSSVVDADLDLTIIHAI
jgi:hypothetical protein